MRILLFFFILIGQFFTTTMHGAQEDRPGDGLGVYAAKQGIATSFQVVGQLLMIKLDNWGIETTKNKTDRLLQEKQVVLSDKQIIGAHGTNKIQHEQLFREQINTFNERREALKKFYNLPENRNKQKEKELEFAELDIRYKALLDSMKFQEKLDRIQRDGQTYKEIERELIQLTKDPSKNKDRIAILEVNKNEIKDEMKKMKKERDERIEAKVKEETDKVEKKHTDKEEKKKNGEKPDNAGLLRRLMSSITTAAEHAGNSVDAVADKSFAHITKHDSFKDTFVETHIKLINRGLVVSSAALLGYCVYRLYNKYTSNDYDLYDNDTDDDDEYDDE